MATTTSITTTYAGEFAGQYVAASLLEAKTLSQGGISIKPNVKFKEVLKRLDLDGIVKDASCDFVTNQGTLTLTEAILTPDEFQVNLQLCKRVDFNLFDHVVSLWRIANNWTNPSRYPHA